MKKIISMLLLIIMIVSMSIPVFADDEEEEFLEDNQIKEEMIETSVELDKQPNLSSRAAVILDRTSKRVLWGKQENTKRAMASTTNIISYQR